MGWKLVPIGDGSVSVAVEDDACTVDVSGAGVPGIGVTAEHLALLPTPARPGEADSPETVAPKISVRLLESHAADRHGVKGHAA